MARNNPFLRGGVFTKIRYHLPIRFPVLLILTILLGTSLSGCVTLADPEASQDYTSDSVGTLDAYSSLGQSIVSRRTSFNGITIWLTRISAQAGETPANANKLTVKLFLTPGDSTPIFTSVITVPASGNNLPVTIGIPSQNNPGGQSYYLLLANDSGTIQVHGRNEDSYPLGSAYLNDQPIDADIAFRLSYDYGFSSLVDDIKNSSAYLWLIAPLMVVLWLPGWLLLELSGLRRRFDFGEQTALAIGFSLALIPVLMLWTTILKITWSSRGLYFVAGFLVAILFVRIIYNFVSSHKYRWGRGGAETPDSPIPPANKYQHATLYSLVLIVIFLFSLAIRLIMVRDLATPAWVDPVHHALITRIIIDNGSYPSTYQPYMDIAPSAYHPGFHSIAAAFIWLSRLDLAPSLLILGQVLNALSVFPVYLFTKTLTHSSTAGLLAAVVTAFFSPMPAYYTSWGRYTELTGLLLLPAIPALLRLWMIEPIGKRSGWFIALGALIGGGLFMIHYRVLAFLVCLVFSYVIFHLGRSKVTSSAKPLRLLLPVTFMTVLGILLVLPWFIQTFKTNLLPFVTSTGTSNVPFFVDFSWPYLTSALGKQVMALAGLGLVWGLVNQKRFTFILILWVFLLFVLANLAVYKLPFGGLISNSSVEIMLFIPISLLAGYFADQLLTHWKELLPSQFVFPSLGIFLIFICFVSYLGGRQLVAILNPVTILTRTADLPAIEWVSQNIPPDETVVINPFAWGYGLFAGRDGGYWISSLAGRPTLTQPVLYGLSSRATHISQMSQQIITLAPDPPAFWEYMRTNDLHYVYIGARGGVISPEKLSSSALFNVLYHQDGVWIFSIKP